MLPAYAARVLRAVGLCERITSLCVFASLRLCVDFPFQNEAL
jgi:hypothetical protein